MGESSPRFNQDEVLQTLDHALAEEGVAFDALKHVINDGDLAEHAQGLSQDEVNAVFLEL